MLEVIGVGFGRTGTHSLKLALEELGYKAFHTMELLADPVILDSWYQDVFSHPTAALRTPDFSQITAAGFTASTDLPMSLYFETLVEKYPDAKFILTTKTSDDDWFRSWERLVSNTSLVPRFVPWFPDVFKFDRYNRWLLSLFHKDDSYLIRSHPLQQDPDKVIQAYRQHNERVRQVIPPERLLEFHPSHGYKPLCDFLDKPVPLETDFPHSNTSAQVASDMWRIVVIYNGMLLIVVIVVVLLLRIMIRKIRPRKSTVLPDQHDMKQE